MTETTATAAAQVYVPQHLSFEAMNGPHAVRRYKHGSRVFVRALRRPAVVLYNLNGGLVQVDTGNGPTLLYEEDIMPVDQAVLEDLTDSDHDAFFKAMAPELQARIIAALSDADRRAYFRYADGTGGHDAMESAGDAPW